MLFCQVAPKRWRMASWTVHCFECADEPAREALLEWFEREHPLERPGDRYSVVAELTVGGEAVWADYAWVGSYCYVTTRTHPGGLLEDTMGRWDRAAVGEFQARTATAETVTLVLDPEAGDEREVAGGRFGGIRGMGGMDVLYALAMRHQFRFRSYSGVPPARHRGAHPDAFTAVGDVERFVADMAEATGIEPTADGRAFLADDPADDDRYVFGETYGPTDAGLEDGPDEAPAFEDLEADLPDDPLPAPEDVLDPAERGGRADGTDRGGVLARVRRLLGL